MSDIDAVPLKELVRDANRPITAADRHAILDLIEALEIAPASAVVPDSLIRRFVAALLTNDTEGSADIVKAMVDYVIPVAPTAEQTDHIAGERKMVAGDGPAEAVQELREAARQFHNLTQGDSTVIIRPPSAEKRDAIGVARAAFPQATAPQPAQSPDGRVIDKAMVKRLAVQHGLLPVHPSLTDGIRKLIECAADCISEAVTWEQSGFDTPPMPATEWDYNADQLAYALRALLTAAQPPSGTPND